MWIVVDHIPVETFHPSVFIVEEMKARGWDRYDLAVRMGGDVAKNLLIIDLYLEVGPTKTNMRIGDGEDFARAFGTSAQFWLNLENQWLKGQLP